MGTTLASPQLGNTQDVALRNWLAEEGWRRQHRRRRRRHRRAARDERRHPRPVQDRRPRRRLAARAVGVAPGRSRPGRKVLVDETDLWPNGEFVDHEPDRAHGVPRGAPGDRRGAAARVRSTTERVDRRRPRRRPRRGQRGARGSGRQAARPPRSSTGRGEPEGHLRPARLGAADSPPSTASTPGTTESRPTSTASTTSACSTRCSRPRARTRSRPAVSAQE